MPDAPDGLKEQVFTAGELAELKKVHPKTIIRWFENEPGVMQIGKRLLRHKKSRYLTLRIPASVADRVFQRMTVGAKGSK